MGGRIYVNRVLDYTCVATMYFLTTLCSVGVLVGFMLINFVFAYLANQVGEVWTQQPVYLIAMLINSGIGALCFGYLQFAGAGSHMHSCAQIGSGQKGLGIVGFVEYMQNNANAFFAIGIVPATISVLLMIFVISAQVLLFSVSIASLIVLFCICTTVWVFVHSFFWFSYASRVVARRHPIDAVKESFVVIIRKIVPTLAFLVILHLLLVAPLITVFFYPIYFFVFFNPYCSIVTVAFYEKAMGILK